MNKLILISLLAFTFNSKDVYSQLNLNSEFSLCCSKSFASKSNKNKKHSSSKVSFVFFQDFNDSVFVLVNNSIVFSEFIIHDSEKVSSKYTGVIYTNENVKFNDFIRVVYKESKQYVLITKILNIGMLGIYNYKSKYCNVSKMSKNPIIR
jgi:hypothetical protein